MLDSHAKPNTKPRAKPTSDVWASMNLDKHLTEKGISMRKATRVMIESCEKDLEKNVDDASFPEWIIPKFRDLKINGL